MVPVDALSPLFMAVTNAALMSSRIMLRLTSSLAGKDQPIAASSRHLQRLT
jgi:hypothetical protein